MVLLAVVLVGVVFAITATTVALATAFMGVVVAIPFSNAG
jgi:hypothetical protein